MSDAMDAVQAFHEQLHKQDGVWLAFYYDGSACVPFATEIEALRHALAYSMQVRFARFGDTDWMNKPERPSASE